MNLSSVLSISDSRRFSLDIPNAPISHLSRRNNFQRLAFWTVKPLIPTYERLSYHVRRATGLSMRMSYCRKIFASYLRSEGIQPEFVDLLQGRVSQSILTRHYLTPDSSLRDNVLAAIENLRKTIDPPLVYYYSFTRPAVPL